MELGQKVVCIKAIDNLKLNEIYTISYLDQDCCRLSELDFEPANEFYHISRFRPLDYDFVEEVIKQVKQIEKVL